MIKAADVTHSNSIIFDVSSAMSDERGFVCPVSLCVCGGGRRGGGVRDAEGMLVFVSVSLSLSVCVPELISSCRARDEDEAC